jgi:predicted nucleic acid-binding protein
MIKIYLESSALWHLHYNEPGTILVKHVLQQAGYRCSSSAWSQVELYRAVQKRFNQKEISTAEAINLRDYIDANIKQLALKHSLELLQITPSIIDKAKGLIVDLNLFSADAVHLASALNEGCSHFLVDDYHFTLLHGKIEAQLGLVIIPTNLDIGLLPKQT